MFKGFQDIPVENVQSWGWNLWSNIIIDLVFWKNNETSDINLGKFFTFLFCLIAGLNIFICSEFILMFVFRLGVGSRFNQNIQSWFKIDIPKRFTLRWCNNKRSAREGEN